MQPMQSWLHSSVDQHCCSHPLPMYVHASACACRPCLTVRTSHTCPTFGMFEAHACLEPSSSLGDFGAFLSPHCLTAAWVIHAMMLLILPCRNWPCHHHRLMLRSGSSSMMARQQSAHLAGMAPDWLCCCRTSRSCCVLAESIVVVCRRSKLYVDRWRNHART